MTSAAALSALFAALVDDAGLFPPEALDMEAATARHRGDAVVGHPVLTQRFLCADARLPELLDALGPDDRFALGLVVRLDPGALGAVLVRAVADPRVELVAVEGALPPGRDLVAAARLAVGVSGRLPVGVAGYVEVPCAGDPAAVAAVLQVLGEGGLAAKVRCGGLRADLFPSCERLGMFVSACVTAGVRFKATAGLHHAVRYRDERTGFVHHGFLNLLLAVCRAVDGAAVRDVVAVLGSVDSEALAAEARQVPLHTARAARALFTSYGSCSTSEPLEDLRVLGLDPQEGAG